MGHRLLGYKQITIMTTTIKKMFGALNEMRDDIQLSKRIILNFSNKRSIWNGRRRFGY
jgi:hypothetical protein